MDIGNKIKTLREHHGYSVREFSKLCSLSPSLVSQVERNQASPSIASLIKMAEVLQCPVGSFFEEKEAGQFIVRKDERRRLHFASHTNSYELITPSEMDGEVRVLLMTLQPGQYSSENKLNHKGKETLFVQCGTVEVEFSNTTHLLHAGDSITFESQNEHRFHNPSKESAQILLIVIK
ncbi:helix-turn-helix domain-containing protein [Ammoniphilus sp. CFH 90114]|uniref:helix-turn-helix domain-containing protein n=1 Tax=Ammoniphilus sp. CFH 90114 TaxID=2493665 RepID=UPI00100E1164|nr:XRE family transcriptional regulator [Ammoniphilus sp. CFH 90114]RXT15461.1 cupin domain-containing protein [Ammoniphilus sp. CFH 90114]